jgi:hypothetical protein
MPTNNGWVRAIAVLAALATVAGFLSDMDAGRLNWRIP